MIWASYPWKEELLRIATRLEKKQKQRRWTERTEANLEKDVFIGCYALRKLMEAHKLSETVLMSHVCCTQCPLNTGSHLTSTTGTS